MLTKDEGTTNRHYYMNQLATIGHYYWFRTLRTKTCQQCAGVDQSEIYSPGQVKSKNKFWFIFVDKDKPILYTIFYYLQLLRNYWINLFLLLIFRNPNIYMWFWLRLATIRVMLIALKNLHKDITYTKLFYSDK